jgi:hypothetical protein
MLTAFPSSRPAQDNHHHQHQQQQNAAAVPEHPQLPVLRCRTTRHRAVGDAAGGTPVAGSRDRDGSFTPLYPAAGGGSPMHVDSCGPGADSDFTPRAGSEDRDLDAPMGSGVRAGHKRSRGGQVGTCCCGWLPAGLKGRCMTRAVACDADTPAACRGVCWMHRGSQKQS